MQPINPNKGNVWNPCQVQGVVAATTTIYLGSGAKFSSKIMFPYKMTSIPTYLAPFQNISFQKITKNGKN